jgi:AraC family transcriptional activator of mtrCDE
MLDLLSDILTRLSVRGALYFRTSFTPPWGVEVPAYENVARFHFAHQGNCMVQVADHVLRLSQGDLVIIPHGASHRLTCGAGPAEDALPLDEVVQRAGFQGSGVLVYGDGDPLLETQLICGHFSFAKDARHLIFEKLPEFILIRNYGQAAGAWLEATLRVIGEEAGGSRMGGDLIALKMSEAIFAQAIRAYIEGEGADNIGLAGFADPRLSRALTAMHQSPAERWSVGDLASRAGMSRTTFAEQFAAKTGMPPLKYLTTWRMQIARQALSEQGLSVAQTAELVGYSSEAAFSRVFSKSMGAPPSTMRRSKQGTKH